MQIQLAHNIFTMAFARPHTHAQFVSNCLTGVTFGNQQQDFPLVPGQSAWLKSKFVFVRKNEGPEAKFKMVRPGDYIDRINTTVADYWANISIADLTNRVEGMTGPIRVESTVE